jgi:hypothetical protein
MEVFETVPVPVLDNLRNGLGEEKFGIDDHKSRPWLNDARSVNVMQ